ncbi:hypothetical protein MLD38_039771 [Melastoma candidum]|uniref:Uncharacterized protein n=1 Tax=Melastoma candidum TaxID=119954 RepID=A0ACB9L4J5_9MYRT|nr:hypothetical protein MLD38_039771 [Melastoma candidum]
MDVEVIVVAVDASKEITDYALEWAVQNLIKPRDSLFLLAVHPSPSLPPPSPFRINQLRNSQFLSKLFMRCRGDKEKSSSGIRKAGHGAKPCSEEKVKGVCEIMMKQLLSAYKVTQVKREVLVNMYSQPGSVASTAEDVGATWVVFDRRLRKEADICLKQLACNVVLVDHTIPRILKAVSPQIKNKQSPRNESDNPYSAARSSFETGIESSFGVSTNTKDQLPRHGASVNDTSTRKPYIYLNSQYFNKDIEKVPPYLDFQPPRRSSSVPPEGKRRSFSGPVKVKNGTVQSPDHKALKPPLFPPRRSAESTELLPRQSSPSKLKELINRKDPSIFHESKSPALPSSSFERGLSIRRAVSLSIKKPPMPPPLCSVCKHNMPHFSNAPKRFTYDEIDRATRGFALDNFLAEGGFGPVYKGILPDGQAVAVKQHKHVSAQGASEFCSEVEVLSCAQHKNLVRLVGYCVETEWLLVYEFACNGSLDKHLYGKEGNEVMAWHNRMKVAKGAARGLRYLHEDCRVGCIVHRDFRPNNILLTHDYEPMVGDFGLARWQANGESAEETRVVGAFGYLAPEYTQTGLVTEKADVYAYGIVLLELLSGFRGIEFAKISGQQFVSDWGLPLLKRGMIDELIDPRLSNDYNEREVELMMRSAELCLSSLPEERPRMSQVLKILEGDLPNTTSSRSSQHAYIYPGDKGSLATMPLMQDKRPATHKHHGNGVAAKNKPAINSASVEALVNPDAYNSEMLASEEFQAYLHGSLAKFMQSMNSQGSPHATQKAA